MAAPTPTARQAPAGRRLWDGNRTKITFARDPDVSLWEDGVTPAGYEGGDPIDTTNHHNSEVRTKRPRDLYEITDGTMNVSFDPNVRTQIRELINEETIITETYPDGTTFCYYGYLKSFIPGEHAEGEEPQAVVTFVCTNWDVANNAEAIPVLTNVAGT